MKIEGRKFMGAKAVKKQSPFVQPQTYEPWRGSHPQVATRDRWRRLELNQRNRNFLGEYELCRDAFKAGDHDVEFPIGTFKLVAYYGARCQGRDPPT